ncbi:MAG: hypothetical protein ACREX8_13545 [Gammaproteobacteria bacterium]
MLGHSGAGKTTYVSLMYREMQDGVAGFQLRAQKPKDHDQLLRDAAAILHGRYPDPTHQRTSYQLVLRYDGEEVFPFRWRDYRGGALNDRSTSADVTELHEDLTSTDGIVLFVDAVKLLTDHRAGRDVRRLVTHVQRALDARDEVLTPLVIAVTKCDLVDLDAPSVLDTLYEPFEPLVEAVGTTEHVYGTILPVACGPEPVNVVIPVLWALRFGLFGRAMRLQAAIESAQQAAAYAASRDTLGDRFFSWLKDEPSWASISQQHQATALDELHNLEPLLEPTDRLSAVLEDVPGF